MKKKLKTFQKKQSFSLFKFHQVLGKINDLFDDIGKKYLKLINSEEILEIKDRRN